MAVRILYVGPDTCHRIPVLAVAGFAVENCISLSHLSRAVAPSPDAILVSDREGELPGDALATVRARSAAPLVLFHDSNRNYVPSGFDLVIPNLTPPPRWLHDISALIFEGRLQHVS